MKSKSKRVCALFQILCYFTDYEGKRYFFIKLFQEEHGGYEVSGDEHESSEKGHDSHDKHAEGHGNEHSGSYHEYHQEGGHEEVHHVEYKKGRIFPFRLKKTLETIEPEHHGYNSHHVQEHQKKSKEECYNENVS